MSYKINLIDVSFSKKDFLKKHRLFLERPFLENLFWLIHDDYPAAKRHLLKYKGGKSRTDYWVIAPYRAIWLCRSWFRRTKPQAKRFLKRHSAVASPPRLASLLRAAGLPARRYTHA